MKKYYYLISGILIFNILPAYSFSDSNDKGLDMLAYANWAGYGFFAMLAVFFSIFLYYSSHDIKKPGYLNSEKIIPEGEISNSLTGEVLAPLNIIYYSIISLLILYAIVFALLIF